MYFSDTMGRRILVYDLDEVTGLPGRPRTLALFEEADGFPDGLCVDSAGALYCAHYGGGCVTRHAPDGLCLETFVLPVRNVTSCCLGGASLNTLYVTTADDAGRDPRDGALFARHALEPGLPEPMYRGRWDSETKYG